MENINSFGLAISRMHRLMERDFEKKLSELVGKDISVSQARAIVFIASRENVLTTQKDLENEFDLKCSSVSLLISSLEKDGYIIREKIDKDARQNKLVLTSKSVELYQVILNLMSKIMDMYLEDVSKEEIEIFDNVLSKVRNSIVKSREKL